MLPCDCDAMLPCVCAVPQSAASSSSLAAAHDVPPAANMMVGCFFGGGVRGAEHKRYGHGRSDTRRWLLSDRMNAKRVPHRITLRRL